MKRISGDVVPFVLFVGILAIALVQQWNRPAQATDSNSYEEMRLKRDEVQALKDIAAELRLIRIHYDRTRR